MPKLCFVQACRGSFNETQGIVSDYRIIRNARERPFHAAKDSYIMHAAVEGNPAWADPQEGSFFIKHLAASLEEFGRAKTLAMIARDVNRRVSNEDPMVVETRERRQTITLLPRVEHSLTRELVFTREALTADVSYHEFAENSNFINVFYFRSKIEKQILVFSQI